jgi:acyl carrier protein
VSSAAEVVVREVAVLTGAEPLGTDATWQELGLDSLDLFTLVTAVEEATGRVVTDAQVARMHCLRDLIGAVGG